MSDKIKSSAVRGLTPKGILKENAGSTKRRPPTVSSAPQQPKKRK